MMKEPTAWLAAARRELDDLCAAGGDALADADAWRALTLTARLRQATDGAPPAAGPDSALVEAWLGACAPPDPTDLCDALGEALAGDDPPEVCVLDAVLDIDDLAGVLWLRGDEGASAVLLEDACVTLSVYPERHASLGGFARMRLATLTLAAPVRVLWSRVDAALIEAAVATQPLAASPSAAALAVRERIVGAHDGVVRLPLRRLRLPAPTALAAATQASVSQALGATADGIDGWVYEDGGTMKVELALLDGARGVRALALVASDGRAELAREALPSRREGRSVFASLGPSVGADNVLNAIGARLGRATAAVEWWIEVEDGE